jgi:hypothetical protein
MRIVKFLSVLLSGLSLVVAGLVATTNQAAAAVKPYHIRASTTLGSGVDIYTGDHCTGDNHWLESGQDALGSGWDSFRTHFGGAMTVRVYSGTTGAFIVERKYYAGECVTAYGNDYLATGIYG